MNTGAKQPLAASADGQAAAVNRERSENALSVDSFFSYGR
jgi:hypothetical protein